MAKCDEGYPCDVCGQIVDSITESQLYLLYVIGEVDPEQLHTTPDRHIQCNPVLAQFIVDRDFVAINADDSFDKQLLDPVYVRARERLVSRGFRRLHELKGQDLPILEYPLPEVTAKWSSGHGE
ncbi:MAG: hypothetical protein CMJ80_15910 [Planctomycetaceae bacterium]|jgi:hypothetical protein|nr:hypothetical protein [Planctomycetaceae bacterium]